MPYNKGQESFHSASADKGANGGGYPGFQAGAARFRLHIFKSRDGALKYQCFTAGGTKPMSWEDILQFWMDGNVAFIREFQQALQLHYDDIFWECSPVRHAAETFEFVIKDAKDALQHRTPTSGPESFDDRSVASFRDLNSDAVLVSPKRIAGNHDGKAYGHLVDFVRNAPLEQQLDLWKEVATQVGIHFQGSKHPLWVSTDGSNVPWLHVRLDTAPKHYKHSDYQYYLADESLVPVAGPDLPKNECLDESPEKKLSTQRSAPKCVSNLCLAVGVTLASPEMCSPKPCFKTLVTGGELGNRTFPQGQNFSPLHPRSSSDDMCRWSCARCKRYVSIDL